MPVDKEWGRHGRSKDALGVPTNWHCPACGEQQVGYRPELGCASCGAGVPKASEARPAPAAVVQETAARAVQPRLDQLAQRIGGTRVQDSVLVTTPAASLRVVRLVEYLIDKPEMADVTLRNSLVGTLKFAWGRLTATIVDTVDPTQEDRLRLAKLQPGVWLGNAKAMDGWEAEDHRAVLGTIPQGAQRHEHRKRESEERLMADDTPPMPDTGPAFDAKDAEIALRLIELVGPRVAHTLALALSSIASELEANSEPEKFISSDEALQLANALMVKLGPWLDAIDVEARTKEATDGPDT